MNSLIRHLKTTLATAALTVLPLSAALAAPTFAISGPTSVTPGTSFSLQVSAIDVTDLYAFQFDISYDPALFSAGGTTEGPFLASGGSTFFDGGMIDSANGIISFVFNTLIGPGPGVDGSGVLASFDFDVEGLPISSGAFHLSQVIALDSSFNEIDVALQGLTVAIPEPAALSLSLAALAALGASARRRRLAPAPLSTAGCRA